MELVELKIQGISYSDNTSGAFALILDEINGNKKLPIVIGGFEAQAIAIALEKKIKTSRPLTHELFKGFADKFDIKLNHVLIHKLIDGVFFSNIVCEKDNEIIKIDSRTSDAIALLIAEDRGALWSGGFKLLLRPASEPELYNILSDPQETLDLSGEYMLKRDELSSLFNARVEEYKESRP